MPDDQPLYAEFDRGLTRRDRRFRFFSARGEIGEAQVRHLTEFDRHDAQAFVGLDEATGAMLGVGRVHRMPRREGEFAVIVRSDLKGLGLGHALMVRVFAAAEALGLDEIVGFVLRENTSMLGFCRDLGFQIERVPGENDMVLARRRSAGATAG